jgi:hypothetical protein
MQTISPSYAFAFPVLVKICRSVVTVGCPVAIHHVTLAKEELLHHAAVTVTIVTEKDRKNRFFQDGN